MNSHFGGVQKGFTLLSIVMMSAAKRAIICEDEKGNITCPTPQTIYIYSANYGRTQASSPDICNDPRDNNQNCYSKTAMATVQSLCNGKGSCTLYVNNTLFGKDPCQHTYKYLDVNYTCIGQGCLCTCVTPDEVTFFTGNKSGEQKFDVSALSIDKRKTSRWIRQHVSASDDRYSSKVIGSIGGYGTLIGISLLIVLPDIMNLYRHVPRKDITRQRRKNSLKYANK